MQDLHPQQQYGALASLSEVWAFVLYGVDSGGKMSLEGLQIGGPD